MRLIIDRVRPFGQNNSARAVKGRLPHLNFLKDSNARQPSIFRDLKLRTNTHTTGRRHTHHSGNVVPFFSFISLLPSQKFGFVD